MAVVFPVCVLTSVASNGYFCSMRDKRIKSRFLMSCASTALSAAASAVFCMVFVRASFAAFVRSVCQLSAFACWYMVLLLKWYFFDKSPYEAPPIYSARITLQSIRFSVSIVDHSLSFFGYGNAFFCHSFRSFLSKTNMYLNFGRPHTSSAFGSTLSRNQPML